MSKRKTSPPLSDEEWEKRLISLAMQQAESQLANQTASSQVVTHFLRLGSMRAELEMKKMELESQLIAEKIQSEKSGQHFAELWEEAITALKRYGFSSQGEDNAELY